LAEVRRFRLSRRAAGVVAGVLTLLCAACTGTAPRPLNVRLDASPAAASFVTPVHISVSGLRPDELVTLRARASDSQGRQWESGAQFRANASGELNLASAVPVSGSYHVADTAGLLWSLRPEFSSDPSAQFYMSYSGFSVTVQVLIDGRVRAERTLHRQAPVPSSTQTVAHDGFAGTLYLPAQTRSDAPAVVVIGGSEGGEDTLTAGALATLGYPAMALGYFGEPGLPHCLCDIPLEYFARAVRWLRAQPAARGRPVILYGVSRGGEGALLIASYEPGLFSAVISSSPSSTVYGPYGGHAAAAWTWEGKPLLPRTEIPVSRIRVPLLIGDGGLDAVWDSSASATLIVSELSAADDHAPHVNLYYPDAGHAFLGTPPYFPYDGLGGLGNALGGSQQANALADEQSWARMIQFINDP
jgi:dienelactone hydrolase